ncbi:Conidiation-specific protein Con-10 [Penicillium bovifimosum]|uniref:Conidiation-specific protein Con-10 n=1 Tax=Penicillium bovifimosum TaxID=126998 RepID=A0A9W9LBG2_9EURO|nr:Conidiation-specific protein Con-10 [Penicillium bovifimosum]KAJ5145886.1 Conidiation-specific protein Con-10 [Penicillium bovifimosum]
MSLINVTRIMSRPLVRLFPVSRSVLCHRCSVATAPPTAVKSRSHPNPGNFANRSYEELSAIGHKGGKKGGKATGVGGFHNMDPEKQRGIAAKGGRAGGRAGQNRTLDRGETELEAEKRARSHEPSVVPPGFEEWKTCA